MGGAAAGAQGVNDDRRTVSPDLRGDEGHQERDLGYLAHPDDYHGGIGFEIKPEAAALPEVNDEKMDLVEPRSADDSCDPGGASDASGDGAKLAQLPVGPSAEVVSALYPEHSVDPYLSTQRSSARVTQPAASAALAGKLSAQFPAVQYAHSLWKKSRIHKGKLIKRLTGYSIAETEYGVSYLWVLSRKPDRTSADNSVHGMAGYYNWKALEESGLLRKEKKGK